MEYDTTNRPFTLVIRTRAYRIVLDVQYRTLRLARAGSEPEWSLSLGCEEGAWSAC